MERENGLRENPLRSLEDHVPTEEVWWFGTEKCPAMEYGKYRKAHLAHSYEKRHSLDQMDSL